MKSVIHSFARALGLRVFRLSTIDRGILVWHDLQRLLGAREARVLFDVGANEGQTARKMRQSFPGAMIYCFEPVSATFARLQANLGRDRLMALEKCALSDMDGAGRMTQHAVSGINRLLDDEGGNGLDAESVSKLKLDTFCSERGIVGIDVLKTDCEGHDLNVLRGASRMFEAGQIRAVYSEVNFLMNGVHADFYSLDTFLRERDMVFYGLYEYSGWQYDVSTDGFMNALFVNLSLLRERAQRDV